jgi:hypothetical protein
MLSPLRRLYAKSDKRLGGEVYIFAVGNPHVDMQW